MNITFAKWLEKERPEDFARLYPDYQNALLTAKRQRARNYQKKMHKFAKQAIRANQES